MSKLVVVAVCGHNKSGKDVVAKTMDLYGDFFRIGNADGVRSALSDIDGPTWELRKESETSGVIARQPMKQMGSEAREAIGRPLLWVDVALAKIHYLHNFHCIPRDKFVIPDVRFSHEIERIASYVSEQNGLAETWRVTRPGFGKQSNHSSETGIDSLSPIHHEIPNEYDKKHLIDYVISIMKTSRFI